MVARSAGRPYHEAEVDQYVARRHLRMPQPLEHGGDRHRADLRARLVDGGQRDRQQTGVLHVVHADEADIARDRDLESLERSEELRGGEVVGTNDAVRTRLAEYVFHLGAIGRVDAADLRGES